MTTTTPPAPAAPETLLRSVHTSNLPPPAAMPVQTVRPRVPPGWGPRRQAGAARGAAPPAPEVRRGRRQGMLGRAGRREKVL